MFSKLSFAQTFYPSTTLNRVSILNQSTQMEYDKHQQLCFLTFQEKATFNTDKTIEVLKLLYNESDYIFQSFKKENDELGFTHEKFSVFYKSLQIAGAVVIVHSKNEKIISINGLLSPINLPINDFRISTSSAFQYAKTHLHVEKMKADTSAELAYYRQLLNDPLFSFEPKVEPIIFLNETTSFKAFKVSFYAEKPLFNGEVYIDAQTGKLLGEYNKVCMIDVPASGSTLYNGTQNFVNEQFTGGYRLRETQRGLGVETYNLNNTSTYSLATDFVNTTSTWTTASIDSTAIGAHWATEKTYDYYLNIHNRNSIDNNGYKLISFVHYSNNYPNAFWNGQVMTYGDGSPLLGYRKMASLDVCGHEVTHGLIQKTAGLGQGTATGESHALNEGWADIIGTSVERYTLPSNWDWIIGKDIKYNNNGIRNIQNPNILNSPDTYRGTFWDFQFNNVHRNGCVAGFWFYLLCSGGSGTNDINNSYSVSAISYADAEKIAFRALTVYFTHNTTFAEARLHTIQSAKDLFGNCSNQVEQVVRAWYAVGVGNNYSAVANPSFYSNNFSCSTLGTYGFVNTTPYALNYNWSFGDGNTSSATSPIHTYSTNGVYTVKLYATGCNNLPDSLVKTAYISVNIPQAPIIASSISVCNNSSATLSAIANGTIQWFNNPSASGLPLASGNPFVTPPLTSNTNYYLLSQQTASLSYGGILSNTAASTSGTYTSGSYSLIFDVINNCTLKTVAVYGINPSWRVISLLDGANVTINTYLVYLVNGLNTIPLNFPLTVGQNFKLNMAAISGQPFFVTTTGVNYPYQIDGCININGSTTLNNDYPWFYNWEVEKKPCYSNISSVNVNVNANPSTTLTVSNTTVCPNGNIVNLTGLPTGGTYSGSGVNGSIFSSSVGIGVYPVNYVYTDGNGCSDSSQVLINVAACLSTNEQSLSSLVSIYPNPTHHTCIIKNKSEKIIFGDLIDVSGKLLKHFVSSEKEFSFLVNDLAKGIYTLKLSDDTNNQTYFKIVVN